MCTAGPSSQVGGDYRFEGKLHLVETRAQTDSVTDSSGYLRLDVCTATFSSMGHIEVPRQSWTRPEIRVVSTDLCAVSWKQVLSTRSHKLVLERTIIEQCAKLSGNIKPLNS